MILVGVAGFEPTTSSSRTMLRVLAGSVGECSGVESSQVRGPKALLLLGQQCSLLDLSSRSLVPQPGR
jgi:hypothetical protein